MESLLAMKLYGEQDIQEVPLRSPFFRNQVQRFLGANGLRMEPLDSYYAFRNADGDIMAGAGLSGDIIKAVAVAPEARSEGLVAPLVSRIISEHGAGPLKVFTKPENQAIFESLGFRLLAAAPLAILMERGRGLEQYCTYLRSFAGAGRCGVVVMNANPFTRGHLYLLEQAAARVDRLFVIPVAEDRSDFPYAERLEMIRAAAASVVSRSQHPVVVLEGSAYAISAATFPTYFLKDLSEASETQMRLDLDLFGRWIAPALNATVRFVGSEPSDPLTNRYNRLMLEVLPLDVVEIPRLNAVSASAVRASLAQGRFSAASALCPASSRPYLVAALADRALRMELDTPCKPGLVGPDGNGAHTDMDYGIMLAGIRALRPFWPRMALAASPEALQQLGRDAEEAMLASTGGVNTHRGAIFCLGLFLNVFARFCYVAKNEDVMQSSLVDLTGSILRNQLKNSNLDKTLVGARALAASGYEPLFRDWLPYYRHCLEENGHTAEVFSEASALFSASENTSAAWQDAVPRQKTLLRIMSMLDDTCVLHRAGPVRAQQVKEDARRMLEEMPGLAGHDDSAGHDGSSIGPLEEMCRRYAAEGISPGGAADMLALTIFLNSILN